MSLQERLDRRIRHPFKSPTPYPLDKLSARIEAIADAIARSNDRPGIGYAWKERSEMSLERSYGEYPKPKGLGGYCCSQGFRREALPRRPPGAPPSG